MLRFHPFLVAILLAGISIPAMAAGEHQRRVATELLVLSGDADRLDSGDISILYSNGLKKRIGGGLAALELFLRLADQEKGRAPRSYQSEMTALRNAWQAKDLTRFRIGLLDLIKQNPFPATGILPPAKVNKELELAKALHEELCAGCHDDSDLEVERPAYNLFNEANTLPEKEFAARMIVGVRGDRITGIDNPFTDSQISALIGYYKSASPK